MNERDKNVLLKIKSEIWETVTKDVPLFLTQIDEILNAGKETDGNPSLD